MLPPFSTRLISRIASSHGVGGGVGVGTGVGVGSGGAITVTDFDPEILNLLTVPVFGSKDEPWPDTVIVPVEPTAADDGMLTVMVAVAVRLELRPEDESLLHVAEWLPNTPPVEAVPIMEDAFSDTVIVYVYELPAYTWLLPEIDTPANAVPVIRVETTAPNKRFSSSFPFNFNI